jgi:hypothetical protein
MRQGQFRVLLKQDTECKWVKERKCLFWKSIMSTAVITHDHCLGGKDASPCTATWRCSTAGETASDSNIICSSFLLCEPFETLRNRNSKVCGATSYQNSTWYQEQPVTDQGHKSLLQKWIFLILALRYIANFPTLCCLLDRSFINRIKVKKWGKQHVPTILW